MNNQYKDIMSSFPTFNKTEPKYVGQDKNYDSKPMLFKEVVEGDHFMYAGEMLTKTGLRTAQSFRKRNIKQFIFNPGDLIHKTFIASDPLKADEAAMFYCPYIPAYDEIDAPNTGDIKDHNPLAEFKKPQCEIIIYTDTHNVEVWEGKDYKWETTIAGDLNKPWSVPICLKAINLILRYNGNEIQLCYDNFATQQIETIWSSPYEQGWIGVSNLIISIKDIKLNFEEFNDF